MNMITFGCFATILEENRKEAAERQMLALNPGSKKYRASNHNFKLSDLEWCWASQKEIPCKKKHEALNKGAKPSKKPSKEGKLECWSSYQRAELRRKLTLRVNLYYWALSIFYKYKVLLLVLDIQFLASLSTLSILKVYYIRSCIGEEQQLLEFSFSINMSSWTLLYWDWM